MKRCPACKRAFDDDMLTVCPDDGSALANAPEVGAPEIDSGLGGKATWNPSQDQLAEIQQTVAAITKPERKSWLWVIVAVAGLFVFIGLVGRIAISRLWPCKSEGGKIVKDFRNRNSDCGIVKRHNRNG